MIGITRITGNVNNNIVEIGFDHVERSNGRTSSNNRIGYFGDWLSMRGTFYSNRDSVPRTC